MTTELKNLFHATSYAQQARESIKHMILTGTYSPGQRLKEMEISAELGISRSPVREAVQRLANEGLVQILPQKGAFVASFDEKEIKELYEVREALEVMAASLSAERANERQVKELENFLESTKSMLNSNEAGGYPSDLDFHKKVADLTQNQKLIQKIAEINSQVEIVRLTSAAHMDRAVQAFEEHVKILEALQQHDSDEASDAMRLHIVHGKVKVLDILKARHGGIA